MHHREIYKAMEIHEITMLYNYYIQYANFDINLQTQLEVNYYFQIKPKNYFYGFNS